MYHVRKKGLKPRQQVLNRQKAGARRDGNPLGVFRASSGLRNACFAFTADSTSAFPQAQLHVIDASTGKIGSAPARQAEYTTACLALFAGPDGMCDGGLVQQVRLRCGATQKDGRARGLCYGPLARRGGCIN
jgi:hypothetical protein